MLVEKLMNVIVPPPSSFYRTPTLSLLQPLVPSLSNVSISIGKSTLQGPKLE